MGNKKKRKEARPRRPKTIMRQARAGRDGKIHLAPMLPEASEELLATVNKISDFMRSSAMKKKADLQCNAGLIEVRVKSTRTRVAGVGPQMRLTPRFIVTADGSSHHSLAASATRAAALEMDRRLAEHTRKATPVEPIVLDAMPLDATRPPQILAVGLSPQLTASIRRVAQTCTLGYEGSSGCDVVVVLHGADDTPTSRSDLWQVKDCALGGVKWRSAVGRTNKGIFDWVFNPTVDRPLLCFLNSRPLVVVSVDPAVPQPLPQVQLVRGTDFRSLFAVGTPERKRIARWETAVARGNLLNVRVVDGGGTFKECLSAFDLAHSHRHGTLHLYWSVHVHGHCAATFTERLPDDHDNEFQARIPYRTHMGEVGGKRHQLWDGLVLAFMPFATKVWKQTTPRDQQQWALPWAQVQRDHPWSYASFSVYSDAKSAGAELGKTLHSLKLQGERNVTPDGESAGLDLHIDEENINFTVVLVFGVGLHGFEQLYPTLGVRVGVDCWAFASANASELLHAVAKGGGFRVALVYAIHETCARGHDHKGKRVLANELRVAKASKQCTV
jgi:hypothetical protein